MRMQQLLLLVQKYIYIFKETYLIVPKNYKKKKCIDSVTNDCQSHSHHINLNMFNKFNLCLNIVISKKMKESNKKNGKTTNKY